MICSGIATVEASKETVTIIIRTLNLRELLQKMDIL